MSPPPSFLDDQRPLLDVFREGVTFDHPQWGHLEPQVHAAGTLRLAGSRVGAGDPLQSDLSAFFAQSVPAGEHPVEAAWVILDDSIRLLAVRVRFAGTSLDALHSVVSADFHGAPPGGMAYASQGVGAFFDPEHATAFDSASARASLEGAFEALESKAVPVVNHPSSSSALVAFRTRRARQTGPTESEAIADHVVASYFAFDANGDPLALWTDFGALHAPEFESVPLPTPLVAGTINHPLLDVTGLSLKVTRWRGQLVLQGLPSAVQTARVRTLDANTALPTVKMTAVAGRLRRVLSLKEHQGVPLAIDLLMGERPLVATFDRPSR